MTTLGINNNNSTNTNTHLITDTPVPTRKERVINVVSSGVGRSWALTKGVLSLAGRLCVSSMITIVIMFAAYKMGWLEDMPNLKSLIEGIARLYDALAGVILKLLKYLSGVWPPFRELWNIMFPPLG